MIVASGVIAMASFRNEEKIDCDVVRASCCRRRSRVGNDIDNDNNTDNDNNNDNDNGHPPASIPQVEFAVNICDQNDLLKLDGALKRRVTMGLLEWGAPKFLARTLAPAQLHARLL